MTLSVVLQDDLERLWTSQPDLWALFEGKSIFLTGGTGFFGVWLLHFFRYIETKMSLGLRVTVLSRTPKKFIHRYPVLAAYPAFTFIDGNVKNFDFPKGKYHFIIHAATTASADLIKNYPLAMLDTIVVGTRRVLDYAQYCGAEKMLYISSGAVYGLQSPEVKLMPEANDISLNPLGAVDAYAMGKIFSEYLCSTYEKLYNFGVTIARCYAFLGPFLPLNIHYAAGNFIRDALNSNMIRIKGDGTPIRSYMYPTDLVEWLMKILLNGESCRAYNVGSDHAITILNLAKAIAAKVSNVEVHIAKNIDCARPANRYVPDISRAKAELSLCCRVSLDDAISRTLSSYC